jgi:predicted metalloendopeptidase
VLPVDSLLLPSANNCACTFPCRGRSRSRHFDGEAWCSNAAPQYLRMLAQSNPHSTPRARANGVVSNMPEFQKAFGRKKGQPMVREDACHVW